MNDQEWMEGFRIASRIYYDKGSLDIGENAVTKGGFKIGEWLQYNRDNVDLLSAFDISNLTSYGMIWNKNMLGNHRNFFSMLSKLHKCEKNEQGLVEWSEIQKDENLYKWARHMTEARKAMDSAYITLREVDMMTDEGFPWGTNYPTRIVEENSWQSKNEKVAQAIRSEALMLLSNRQKLREQLEKHGMSFNNGANTGWRAELLNKYLGVTDKPLSKNTVDEYIKSLNAPLSEKEREFFKLLNDSEIGVAAWIVKNDSSTKVSTTIDVLIMELNLYLEQLGNLGADYTKIKDFDNKVTSSGTSVTDMIEMLRSKIIADSSGLIRENVMKRLNPYMWKQFVGKKLPKTDKNKTKTDNDTDTEKEKWTIASPKNWFNGFMAELKLAEKNGLVPNNIKETDNEKLRTMIQVAYANKSKLENRLFITRLNNLGFFFIDKSTKRIDSIRVSYNKFFNLFKAYADRFGTAHGKDIARALLRVRSGSDNPQELIEELDKYLEADFAEYKEFMRNYRDIMNSGTAREKEIANVIKESIPFVLRSKKMRA